MNTWRKKQHLWSLTDVGVQFTDRCTQLTVGRAVSGRRSTQDIQLIISMTNTDCVRRYRKNAWMGVKRRKSSWHRPKWKVRSMRVARSSKMIVTHLRFSPRMCELSFLHNAMYIRFVPVV